MAEIIKFHEKNIAVFGNIESTTGTYAAPAATDALASTGMDGSVTYQTGSFMFLGDSLSRDEYTYIQDTFAEFTVDTFQQVLGGLDTTSTGTQIRDNFAPNKFFRACGANVAVITGGAWNSHPVGSILFDNVDAENSSISIDYRKSSQQDAVYQNLQKFLAIRGSVDINASLGSVPTLKFSFKGNATNPIAAPYLSPNFGTQARNVASSVRKVNVVSSVIYPVIPAVSITFSGTTATVTAPSHGLANGDSIEISGVKYGGGDNVKYNGKFTVAGATTNTFTYTMSGTPSANATGSIMIAKLSLGKSFNFSTLNAPNFFGFDYSRYLTSTEEGYTKMATPTDVSIGMVEDQAPSWAAVSITRTGTTATVTLSTAHGLSNGDKVTISGATDSLYNGTFAIAGVSGATFTYTMTGTPAANAVANTDGSLVVANNQATNFDPLSNITEFFAVKVKFGTGAGKYVTYAWNKLQLATVKPGKVSNLFSYDLTFRNTGKSYIFLE